MRKFKHIYTEAEREAQIENKLGEFKEILKDADAVKLKAATGLIEQAAFFSVCLDELNKIIMRDGFVDTYQNGEHQCGTKKSVAADLMERYTKTYSTVTRQLLELLPDADDRDAAKELMGFVNGSDTK